MTVSDTPGSGRVHAVLPEIEIFSLMPRDVRDLVVGSLEPVSYEFGQVIVREGEEADAFYVIVSGTARALKATEGGDEVALETLHRGDDFGFVELIEGTPRAVTVRASSELSALRLDRAVFQALLRTNPRVREHFELPVRMHHLRHFLRVDSAFGGLSGESLAALLRELREADLPAGAAVYREGEATGSLYVIREGRARVSRAGTGDVGFLRRGDSFGEASLVNGTPRGETVEAVSDLRLLELPAGAYRRLLESDPALRARIEEKLARREYRERAHVPLDFAEEILPAVSAVHQVPDTAAAATPAPEAEEFEPAAEQAAKPIRRFPHVYQVDEADCGAACLAMVCRHFGREVGLSHIRDLVATGTDGTSLAGIARGGEGLGLSTRAVKASKSRLDQMPLPAVVHWEGNHWVVLYAVEDGKVRVADPALGLRTVARDDFLEKWSGYAALVAYTPAFEQAPEGRSDMSWLWPHIRPHRRALITAAVLALVAAALQFLIPVLTQVIVDDAIAEQDRGLLNTIAIALAGLIVLMVLVTVYQRYVLSKAAVRIDASTLDFLTDRLLALPMRYFHSRRTGDIEQRLAGLRQVREFVVQSGVQALTAATQLVVAVVLMLLYSPLLTLVYLGTVPFYIALMRYSRRRLRPMFDTLEESFGRYQSKQIDAIKGIETVKAMGAEPSLRRLLTRQFDTLADRVFRADFTIMTYEALVSSVTLLSLGLFLWIGAGQVLDGNLTIGELVAFNSLVLLANAPIGLVLALWDQYQFSSVLLNRMNDIFEQEPEQGADHAALRPVPTLSGRISLRDVGFRYGGPGAPAILEGISFDVEPGTTVAIVGRSGSGKTTLVKCLAGLLEPTEGSIHYDGVDMRTLSWRELRRHIGFVLQESYLFDDTLAENIAFGSEQMEMDKVVWAAKAAAAHEFVSRLPLGYETRVGETGLLLSGGQKQRVAIARALYERPPVLIFDEATSSLDTESERAVKQSMDSLLSGRTSFVIAHRLSTIRDADVILVLEKGRLVEQGTHEELMARQGLYFYLSSQQLEL